jgi:hypothetical protein
LLGRGRNMSANPQAVQARHEIKPASSRGSKSVSGAGRQYNWN